MGLYGFGKNNQLKKKGGKPRLQHFNFKQTLHCFPLNGNPEKPEVCGI